MDDDFRKYVKEEKTVREGIARMSTKPMLKVQEDIAALKQLLAVVSNGLQRNACAVEKLKHEMTQVRTRTTEWPRSELVLPSNPLPSFLTGAQNTHHN